MREASSYVAQATNELHMLTRLKRIEPQMHELQSQQP